MMISAMMAMDQIRNGYAANGVDLSDDARRAFDTWDACLAAGRHDTAAAVEALRDDIETDAIDVPTIVERLTATARAKLEAAEVQQLVRDLELPLAARTRRAFLADAGRVVAELRPRFDDAARTVATGLDHFDVFDYANRPDVVLRKSAAAASAHHATQAASAALGRIRQFVVALVPNITARWALFVRVGDDAPEGTAATISAVYGSQEEWLAITELPGVELALNTPDQADEVIARCRAIDDAHQQRRASGGARRRSNEGWTFPPVRIT
jgi:hypothetical protein